MTRFPALLLTSLLATAGPSPASTAEPSSGEVPREWTIRPRGLGLLNLERTVTVDQARALYPEAKVEVRKGRYDFFIAENLFYVFVDGDRELFASNCFCELDANGEPHSTLEEIARPGEMWLHPITTDPRFRTERGIGVGSTVRELVKAYPEFPRLVYHQNGVTSPHELPAEEYVCLLKKGAEYGRADTIENVKFYVRHPGGKIPAGQPREGHLKKQRVDLRAVIVAVQPGESCRFDEHPF